METFLEFYRRIIFPMRPWWPVSAFIKHIRGQYNGFIVPIWPTVLGFLLLFFAGAVGYEMYNEGADWPILLSIIFIIGVLGGFQDVETRRAPEMKKG